MEVVRFLLEHGFDAESAAEDEWSAIELAVASGLYPAFPSVNFDMAKLLSVSLMELLSNDTTMN